MCSQYLGAKTAYNDIFYSNRGKTTATTLLHTKIKLELGVPDTSSISYCGINTGELGQHLLPSNHLGILVNYKRALSQCSQVFLLVLK